MYAIVEDSGTQIKLTPDEIVEIDLRDAEPGSTITFDRVLLLGPDEDQGTEAVIGTPYVEGATVSAEVLDRFKDEKIDVIKFKRRKGYRVKQGHRQQYLRVKVGPIVAG